MIIKEKACCFTGHRRIPSPKKNELRARLEHSIERLIQNGYEYFLSGGALGFDMLAALAVLKLKTVYPNISLIMLLPCKNQAKNWTKAEKAIHSYILSYSDEVIYISEEYHDGCMQKRNRALVDNSSYCIAYLTRPSGGTAYTVSYAKRNQICVENLAIPSPV